MRATIRHRRPVNATVRGKNSMNRLAEASSPYLLQHADNPVDWYPWGDEAFGRARAEDRPLLVSVGYSSCHWCHVMEHESFSDRTTASLMNELFVNVKVDREERPDVDALTMDACVTMTGQGGWPTTVFLTPEGRPFYAGTYFPPEPRHGIPSFAQLLRAIASAWRDQRSDLESQAAKLVDALGGAARLTAGDAELTPALLDAAERALARDYEPAFGGFGRAPKFPPSSALELLLRRGGDGGARHGAAHARRDGGGRPLRRRGRGLPPLLGRRPLARAALREDAVRQRATRLDVPPRLGRDGRGALPVGRRGDDRLPPARDAPRERRLRVRTGRRHRRRRRADVHLDVGGVAGARARPVAPRALRARPRDRPGRARRRDEEPGCSRSATSARSPSATTKRSPPGTGSRLPHWRKRHGVSTAATGCRPPRSSAGSCSGRSAARTDASCGASATAG